MNNNGVIDYTIVKKITSKPGVYKTYNIAGEGCKNYFANGILVHDECMGVIRDSTKKTSTD
ncbi:MAG: hypothetical protein R3E32_15020 [Chitinophagales bacterium]